MDYFCIQFKDFIMKFNLLEMKRQSFLVIVSVALLISCQSSGDKSKTTVEQEVAKQKGAIFTVDQNVSTLKWTGYHKGGIDPRFGTLKSSGTVAVESGAITGGSFVIDINSVLTDKNSVDAAKTGGKTAADLDEHLKNDDFFQSSKYPTAKFEITNIGDFDAAKDKSILAGANQIISGNLTIKDKTINLTFPAKVGVADDNVSIDSKFTINRQNWGLTYGTDGDPKDWIISEEVDLELHIQAKK